MDTPQAAPVTEQRIFQILQAASDEWDRIHGNGWNEAYLSMVPTMWHLAARRICEEIAQAPAGG